MPDSQIGKSSVNDAKLDLDIYAITTAYSGHSGPRKGILTLHFTSAVTPEDQEAAIQVALAHNPLDMTPAQQSAAAEQAVLTSAKATIATVPGWASWTNEQAQTWIDANVTDLPSAIVALKKMAQMIILIRDHIRPDLNGG